MAMPMIGWPKRRCNWTIKALNALAAYCQILLIAASWAVSIFAAGREEADAPSDQTIRNALAATLSEMSEPQRRPNWALATETPKALRRESRMIAIDLTLIPYHGTGGREGGIPQQPEVRHYALSRLCHGGGRPQGASLHTDPDDRREVENKTTYLELRKLQSSVRRRNGGGTPELSSPPPPKGLEKSRHERTRRQAGSAGRAC